MTTATHNMDNKNSGFIKYAIPILILLGVGVWQAISTNVLNPQQRTFEIGDSSIPGINNLGEILQDLKNLDWPNDAPDLMGGKILIENESFLDPNLADMDDLPYVEGLDIYADEKTAEWLDMMKLFNPEFERQFEEALRESWQRWQEQQAQPPQQVPHEVAEAEYMRTLIRITIVEAAKQAAASRAQIEAIRQDEPERAETEAQYLNEVINQIAVEVGTLFGHDFLIDGAIMRVLQGEISIEDFEFIFNARLRPYTWN